MARQRAYDDRRLFDFVGYNSYQSGVRRGVVAIPVTLDTPWSNVIDIHREVRQNRRGVGLATMVLSTLIVGLVGGSFVLADPHDTVGLRPIGEITLGVGLLVDLLLVPSLFAHDSTDVLYPRARD